MWVDKKRCPAKNACKAIPKKAESPRVKEYQKTVKRDAIASMQGARCTKRLVKVTGWIFVKDVSIRDVTNMLESVFDALQDIVYQNDFQIHELGPIRRRLDRNDPRVELTIWEVEDPVWEDAQSTARARTEKARERKRRKKTGQGQGRLV
jgi:Holliday junction resolvase RusA-like endonuclease